jgi:hypothetical protein
MLLLLACVIHDQTVDQTFEVSDSIDAILVSSDAGNVTVVAGNGPGVSLTTTSHWVGNDPACPEISVDRTGTTLQLRGSCPDLTIGCSVDWQLEVAPGITLEVESGAGDLVFRELSGTITAQTDAGDIMAESLSGKAILESAAGDINGLSLSASDFGATTAAGDISLTFTDSSTASIRAESSAGDIFIAVPSGAWNLDLWTAAGDVQTFNVEDVAEAGRSLKANSGAGDIQVTGG